MYIEVMTIDVNGTTTHYHDINPDMPHPVIFLHGWANTSDVWLPIAKKLPPTFRYLVVDLPGFGRTHFIDGSPSVPEYTQFVIDFINKLNLKKPILFGHSFGGQISLDLALKQPELISALVLLSPAGIGLHQRFQNFRTRVIRTLDYIEAKTNLPLTKPLLQKIGSSEYATAIREHRELLHNILRYDMTTEIYKIGLPIQLLWGSEDKVIPLNRYHLLRFLPQAHISVIPSIGHLPPITHLSLITSEISKALASVSPGPR